MGLGPLTQFANLSSLIYNNIVCDILAMAYHILQLSKPWWGQKQGRKGERKPDKENFSSFLYFTKINLPPSGWLVILKQKCEGF